MMWVFFCFFNLGGLYSTVTCMSWDDESVDILRELMDTPAISVREDSSLGIDEAGVVVQNTLDRMFEIFSQYDMCWKV